MRTFDIGIPQRGGEKGQTYAVTVNETFQIPIHAIVRNIIILGSFPGSVAFTETSFREGKRRERKMHVSSSHFISKYWTHRMP